MKTASELKSMIDMAKTAEQQFKTMREFEQMVIEGSYGLPFEETEKALENVTIDELYAMTEEQINEFFVKQKKNGITTLKEIVDDMDSRIPEDIKEYEEELKELANADGDEIDISEESDITEDSSDAETIECIEEETVGEPVDGEQIETDDDEMLDPIKSLDEQKKTIEDKIAKAHEAIERHNNAKSTRSEDAYVKLRVLEDVINSINQNKVLRADYNKIIDEKNEAIQEYVAYTHSPEYREAQKKQYEALEEEYEKETDPAKKRRLKTILDSYYSAKNYTYIFLRLGDEESIKKEMGRLTRIFFSERESKYLIEKYTKVMTAYGFTADVYRAFLNIEETFLPSEYHVYNNLFVLWVLRYISHMDRYSKTDKYMVSSIMMSLSNLIYHRFDSEEDEKAFLANIMKLEDYLTDHGYYDKFKEENSSYHPNISIVKKAEENGVPTEVMDETIVDAETSIPEENDYGTDE